MAAVSKPALASLWGPQSLSQRLRLCDGRSFYAVNFNDFFPLDVAEADQNLVEESRVRSFLDEVAVFVFLSVVGLDNGESVIVQKNFGQA